ncbi:hypothetical protein HDU80_008637 [Chytriomyces hyalinus]|nr:hypothetical protein HDU80_008637 [Chytriomyces hyalinus]
MIPVQASFFDISDGKGRVVDPALRGKAGFLAVTVTWCGWCDKLKKGVLEGEKTFNPPPFEFYYLDVETDEDKAKATQLLAADGTLQAYSGSRDYNDLLTVYKTYMNSSTPVTHSPEEYPTVMRSGQDGGDACPRHMRHHERCRHHPHHREEQSPWVTASSSSFLLSLGKLDELVEKLVQSLNNSDAPPVYVDPMWNANDVTGALMKRKDLPQESLFVLMTQLFQASLSHDRQVLIDSSGRELEFFEHEQVRHMHQHYSIWCVKEGNVPDTLSIFYSKIRDHVKGSIMNHRVKDSL